ncbi:hypothetical protein BVY01_01065 [bacterium I07]|nr:hypothetical protein BVY01_01065 [bacterium I07]
MGLCGKDIEKSIVETIDKEYKNNRSSTTGFWGGLGVRSVRNNRNFNAHVDPEGKNIDRLIVEELRRRIKLGFKGQGTTPSQSSARFSGIIHFRPADCPHNKKLLEDRDGLPGFSVRLGSFLKKKPAGNQPHHRQEALKEIFNLPDEVLDLYTPNLKAMRVRFTLEPIEPVQLLIKNLTSPFCFSFIVSGVHDFYSALRVEQNVSGFIPEKSRTQEAIYQVVRRASYSLKHVKEEGKINRWKNKKKRDDEIRNRLITFINFLDAAWTEIGESVQTVSDGSAYSVPTGNIGNQFEKLLQSYSFVKFLSKSPQRSVDIEYSNRKFTIMTEHDFSKEKNTVETLQSFYQSILNIGFEHIHWSIDHPKSGIVHPRYYGTSGFRPFEILHPLLVNGYMEE